MIKFCEELIEFFQEEDFDIHQKVVMTIMK